MNLRNRTTPLRKSIANRERSTSKNRKQPAHRFEQDYQNIMKDDYKKELIDYNMKSTDARQMRKMVRSFKQLPDEKSPGYSKYSKPSYMDSSPSKTMGSRVNSKNLTGNSLENDTLQDELNVFRSKIRNQIMYESPARKKRATEYTRDTRDNSLKGRYSDIERGSQSNIAYSKATNKQSLRYSNNRR